MGTTPTTKTPSLTRNALLNSMKTVMSLIFPLITFPYVSRVLGAANIGKINYSLSIVSYFALFAALGISNYAIREGAKIKRDQASLTRFARQIFTINLVSSGIAYLAFLIVVFALPDLHAYWAIGVDWLYSIFEDYFYLSVRTIAVQFASLILMFIFVHKPSDYVIYAGISVFASSAANVWGFFHARKFCTLRPTRRVEVNRHIGPIMTLFMNNVAINIYSNAGTTFVGAMMGDVQVGLYSVAMKIYSIARQVINSLTVVSLPRLSYLSANDRKGYIALLNRLFNTIIVTCIPAAILLYALSSPIVLIISGPKYVDAIPMLQIIAFGLALAVPNSFLTSAILIPLRREKKVVISTASGAAVNIALDLALIPFFGTYAACVSIVIAELVVTVLSLAFSFDQITQLKLGASFVHTAVGCALIVACHMLCMRTVHIGNPVVDFLVRGGAYAIVYGLALLVMRDDSLAFFLRKLRRPAKR